MTNGKSKKLIVMIIADEHFTGLKQIVPACRQIVSVDSVARYEELLSKSFATDIAVDLKGLEKAEQILKAHSIKISSKADKRLYRGEFHKLPSQNRRFYRKPYFQKRRFQKGRWNK